MNDGETITIQYSLTRMEIVGYFLRSLPRSPRLLMIVFGSSLLAGFGSLAISTSLRRVAAGEILDAGGVALGFFCLFVLLVFVQAKTQERTLTVSEEGLSTWIGSMRATIAWTKIATVKSVGRHILIVRATGNSFLIPMRAFQGADQYARFLEVTQEWQRASR